MSESVACTVPQHVAYVLDAFGESVQECGQHEPCCEWVALCPHPHHGFGDGDHEPSVRIAYDDFTQKILVTCRVGCPTKEVLQAVGLSFRDLFGDASLPSVTRKVTRPFGAVRTQLPASFLDEVYRRFLNGLQLSIFHRERLTRRGFDQRTITLGHYRTFEPKRVAAVCERLNEQYGRELVLQVPGFAGSASSWFNGLIVPCLDPQFRIVGLKIRRDIPPPKYVSFSTASCSCGPQNHYPVSGKFPPVVELWITEGELKAEFITQTLQVQSVSVPGVGLWRQALEAVKYWKPARVVLAFDWPDVLTKIGVRESLYQLYASLLEHGVPTTVARWDVPGVKGIDDLLVTGELPTMTDTPFVVEPARAPASVQSPPAPTVPTMPPVASFPVSFFPQSLQPYMESIAASLPCPLDFVCCSAVTVAGAMIGTTHHVEMFPDWHEYGALFTAIVGIPGVMKTEATKRPLSPARVIQNELMTAYREQYEHWKQEYDNWKVYKSTYQSSLKAHHQHGADHPGEIQPPPKRPPVPTLVAMNTTLEALFGLLQDAPRGILLYKGELISWTREFDQYRSGGGGGSSGASSKGSADKPFFLEVWSQQELRIDRKGSLHDPIWIQRPFLSVLGTIQPDKIGELMQVQAGDDGFVDRILFCVPSCEASLALPTVDHDKQTEQAWTDTIRALRALEFTPVLYESGTLPYTSQVIVPTPEARHLWESWYEQRILGDFKKDEFPAFLKGPWQKLKAYSVRFALIAHCLRLVAGEPVTPLVLDTESVRRGIELAEYFMSHWYKIHWLFGQSPTDRRVRDFVNWLTAKGIDSITVRELYRKLNGRFGVKGVESCVKLLKAAQDQGYGTLGVSRGRNAQERQHFFLGSAKE